MPLVLLVLPCCRCCLLHSHTPPPSSPSPWNCCPGLPWLAACPPATSSPCNRPPPLPRPCPRWHHPRLLKSTSTLPSSLTEATFGKAPSCHHARTPQSGGPPRGQSLDGVAGARYIFPSLALLSNERIGTAARPGFGDSRGKLT
ncbi:hypothetical protein F5X68DRAFT_32028 [Plectosphaerella plurivora]|uniref:Secreted protein n=1 Tax=Plectosphaerella plurivora TaxID=936078 RepID=A0A9P9ACT3_9PEZI|nr:hypothetical protein F5X68DRAFT_32028 [Plectosphaerella plurivora]